MIVYKSRLQCRRLFAILGRPVHAGHSPAPKRTQIRRDFLKRILSLPPVAFALETADTYGQCGLSQAAAALSYFLVLTLFPLLMCINYFIGLFHFDLEQLLLALDQVLPAQALSVIQDYLTFASQNQSPALMFAAVFAIILSASAGLRTLLLAMDKLYGEAHPEGIQRIVVSVAVSLLFLLTIYLSVVVIFTGDWFFHVLQQYLPQPLLNLIPLKALSGLWRWIRYLLLFCFMLLLVLAIYRLGTPRKVRRKRDLLVSAVCTAAALVAGSLLFSWFIGMSSRYSMLYGSLASLIIILVWLYFCGNVLMMGALLSRAWTLRRAGRTRRR